MRVFTFPADADRRRRWLKAIPRADFEPGKRSVVSLKRVIFIARRLCGDILNYASCSYEFTVSLMKLTLSMTLTLFGFGFTGLRAAL